MYKCLIIEDDLSISRLLKNFFMDKYQVFVSSYGLDGVEIFKKENPDFIVLDLGLPDIDGKEVIKLVKSLKDTPILILSARSEDKEKVQALELGADDYVVKPFSLEELQARVKVFTRRLEKEKKQNNEVSFFKNGELYINYELEEVYLGEKLVHLTPSEYKILTLLAKNVGKIITYSQINQELFVNNYVDEFDKATIRVFVAGLRKKIEKTPSSPKYIITHLGTGYHMAYI